MQTDIILLGHGSRNETAARELSELAATVARLRPDCRICPAYLQFGDPLLADAVTRSVQAGAERIVIIPVFLFAGSHVERAIPETMAVLRSQFPAVRMKVGRYLGPDRVLADLIGSRIDEAVAERD